MTGQVCRRPPWPPSAGYCAGYTPSPGPPAWRRWSAGRRLRRRTRVTALAERVGYPTSDELIGRAEAVIGQRAGLRDLRLTHMDLRPENLCFQGDDLVAVLDLSNCTLGDPATELGRMAAYGTLTRDLLGTYADGEPLDH